MNQSAHSSGIRLGRIFGIPIYLHTSWFIIFALITLSLRMQFALQHPRWTPAQHWALGIITSLVFFASVLFHEMCHSVVALHYRLPVKSITLFVFGGVSQIEREPPNARQEFTIAIAGPLSSLFLAGCFWLVAHFVHGSEMVAAVAGWLWEINLVLAIFNLVPGFPLDGGRVLRGIAWAMTGSFTRASVIASTSGRVFAYLMIFVGIYQALSGNFIGGLWLAFIGWFLLEAARESYAQVAIRSSLTGLRTSDIMSREIPTIPGSTSIEEYVHEVLRTGQRSHIVAGAEHPSGLITLRSARHAPREEWPNTSVQAVMVPMDQVLHTSPEEAALQVLERMQKADINQMPVVSEGRIVGMVSREAILRVLQTRMQAGHLAES